MSLQSMFSSLLAIYLIASPCFAIQHDDPVHDPYQVASEHTHFGHDHSYGDSDTDEEHCCDDLSSSIHASLKNVPTDGVFVVVVPKVDIVAPYIYEKYHVAFARDGPLYEQAREHTKTVVIIS